METAILASFFHRASSQSRPLHHCCRDRPDSWCRRKKIKKLVSMVQDFLYKNIAKVKPIYQKLRDKALLENCWIEKTQNQNESLNAFCNYVIVL